MSVRQNAAVGLSCVCVLQEAATRRIPLPEDHMPSVARMVEYCHVMDYPEGPVFEYGGSPDPSYLSPAHTNAQVYVLAHKYGFCGLGFLASRKLDVAMKDEFGSAQPRPDMAHLIAIISLAYGSTPESDPVRALMIIYVREHWEQLSPMPEFHEVIAADPMLAVDLVNKNLALPTMNTEI